MISPSEPKKDGLGKKLLRGRGCEFVRAYDAWVRGAALAAFPTSSPPLLLTPRQSHCLSQTPRDQLHSGPGYER